MIIKRRCRMINKALLLFITLMSVPAFAQDGSGGNMGYIAMGAAIAIAVAALGGALGQGKIGGSAVEGIARNPKASKEMFVPMILGLVLIESLVIYAFVIAFMLVGKM